MLKVREPEFAGSFYPGDAAELEQMLEYLFERAARKREENVKGVISPHAGYIYSGKIAASSYRQLEGEGIKTFILLGPSHHYAFYGASVWKEGKWFTPLGEVEIDQEIAEYLIENSQYLLDEPLYHIREHSLEVQVPFLQYLFEDFKIVPVVFGHLREEMILDIAKVIRQLIGEPEIGFVISSDFYHGYNYEEGLMKDEYSKELILKMDGLGFYKEAVFTERAMACGVMGLSTFLEAGKGILEPFFVDYTNSAQVTGDYTGYVVGYLSIGFKKEG